MKYLIEGIKVFLMVIGAACCGLFLLAWSDIHWMLTSPDDAIAPWMIGDCEGCILLDDEDAHKGRDIGPVDDVQPGPEASPSLDESGPPGVTR